MGKWGRLANALKRDHDDFTSFGDLCEEVRDLVALREAQEMRNREHRKFEEAAQKLWRTLKLDDGWDLDILVNNLEMIARKEFARAEIRKTTKGSGLLMPEHTPVGITPAEEFRKARLAIAFELGYGHTDIGMAGILHNVKELIAFRETLHPRHAGASITVDDNIKVGEAYVRGDGSHMVHVGATNYPTRAAEVIFEDLIPKWTAEFLKKNAHYGNTYESLGTSGQFADIWRKVGPLKKLLWDNKFEDWDPETGESAEDICNDLIGHLFLTLAILGEGNGR